MPLDRHGAFGYNYSNKTKGKSALPTNAKSFVGPNDIQITINLPQDQGQLVLSEMSPQDLPAIAKMARRVALRDTGDILWRAYMARKNKNPMDAYMKQPCVAKHLDKFAAAMRPLEENGSLDKYRAAMRNKLSRKSPLVKQMTARFMKFCENLPESDLYINYTSLGPSKPRTKADYFKLGVQRLLQRRDVQRVNYKPTDGFGYSVEQMMRDDMDRRNQPNRKAHWMVIKKDGAVIGMTFISSTAMTQAKLGDSGHVLKELNDADGNTEEKSMKITNDIVGVGHSGNIFDPDFQGMGYGTKIKAVMVDFIYDNNPKLKTDKKALFRTTCNELNAGSEKLQNKSGARAVVDSNGNYIVQNGKLHWYATANSLDAHLLRPNSNVSYTVEKLADGTKYEKHLGFDKTRQPLHNFNYIQQQRSIAS